MVYLNDGFEGGDTRFYTDDQPTYTEGLPSLCTHTYTPKRGDCLVFNSGIVHDGARLISGTK
jgi:hypothetical protein